MPAASSDRGEKRPSQRPTRSATTAASGAATIPSWPAVETDIVEVLRATSPRIGESTSTPAWLAEQGEEEHD